MAYQHRFQVDIFLNDTLAAQLSDITRTQLLDYGFAMWQVLELEHRRVADTSIDFGGFDRHEGVPATVYAYLQKGE